MNNYTRRFKAAVALVDTVKQKAHVMGAKLVYDGEVISPSDIVVSDEEIRVVSGNCSYLLFELDEDYDHGAHTNIDDWAIHLRKCLKMYKEIPW